jgi:hypothetical protein
MKQRYALVNKFFFDFKEKKYLTPEEVIEHLNAHYISYMEYLKYTEECVCSVGFERES